MLKAVTHLTQVQGRTRSQSPGRLLLLSARPMIMFPAAEHHCHMASTKVYHLVTEAHASE